MRLKIQSGARKILANNSSGRAATSARPSARSSANILGINSPSTMCRNVIAANAMMMAIKCATYPARPCEAILDANGCSNAATVGSPIQPNASEAIVIPN